MTTTPGASLIQYSPIEESNCKLLQDQSKKNEALEDFQPQQIYREQETPFGSCNGVSITPDTNQESVVIPETIEVNLVVPDPAQPIWTEPETVPESQVLDRYD